MVVTRAQTKGDDARLVPTSSRKLMCVLLESVEGRHFCEAVMSRCRGGMTPERVLPLSSSPKPRAPVFLLYLSQSEHI